MKAFISHLPGEDNAEWQDGIRGGRHVDLLRRRLEVGGAAQPDRLQAVANLQGTGLARLGAVEPVAVAAHEDLPTLGELDHDPTHCPLRQCSRCTSRSLGACVGAYSTTSSRGESRECPIAAQGSPASRSGT